MQFDRPGPLNRLAKLFAPILTRSLVCGPVGPFIRLLENYLAILQGKGAGSGWDLAGEIENAAAQIRRVDPVIIDVGANRGEWSQELARRLQQPNARFFLVEPQPTCRPLLERLPAPPFTFLPVALGASCGRATLYTDQTASPLATLHPRRDSYHQGFDFQHISVPILTLDQIVSAYGLTWIDFLKLDVEGHELAVLQGARQTLLQGRVGAMTFEFGSANINARTYFHDYWDLLTSLGYSLLRVAPGGVLIPVSTYYEDLESFRGATNYLAVLDSAVTGTWPAGTAIDALRHTGSENPFSCLQRDGNSVP